MNKQKGYTIYEMFVLLMVLVGFATVCSAGYVAWHFIAKFW